MGANRHLDDGSIAIIEDAGSGKIVRFDSATFVQGFYDAAGIKHAPDVVVAASYSGVLCARMIAGSRPRGVIGLDCGIGKDGAGVAGLAYYEALSIPAAAVDVATAEMGNGRDLYEHGVISRANDRARQLGIVPGMDVRATAQILIASEQAASQAHDPENRLVVHTNGAGRSIVCTDSIAFARPEDRETNVLCTAGHTGRSVIDYIVDSRPWGFICSDGGMGKNNAGIAALPIVNAQGVAGASVSAMSARMGDGQSTYFDGVISAANDLAIAKGVSVGQSARDAALALLA